MCAAPGPLAAASRTHSCWRRRKGDSTRPKSPTRPTCIRCSCLCVIANESGRELHWRLHRAIGAVAEAERKEEGVRSRLGVGGDVGDHLGRRATGPGPRGGRGGGSLGERLCAHRGGTL